VATAEFLLLRRARGDALVASLPTLAYAGGGIHSLRTGALCGIACAVVLGALAARRRPVAAVSGLIAVVFAVGVAVITKRPTAFFLPAIALNGVLAAGGAGSLMAGRPVLGYTLGTFLPRFAGWRADPALRKVAAAVTAVWSAVFLLRFVIMGTCYLAGAGPSVLAVVKVVLGLPIAAVAAAISLRLVAEPDESTGPAIPVAQPST
jgi:hypothetical protein